MKKETLAKELLRKVFEGQDYELTNNQKTYKKIITQMTKNLKKTEPTKITALDMKGLLYGPVVAYKLKLPFVPILKGGKLNKKRVIKGTSFTDYSKKTKSIEILKGSIQKGDRIAIIDDWFETGKTGKTAIKLIEKMGGKIVGITVIINQLKQKDWNYFSKYNFSYIARKEPTKK